MDWMLFPFRGGRISMEKSGDLDCFMRSTTFIFQMITPMRKKITPILRMAKVKRISTYLFFCFNSMEMFFGKGNNTKALAYCPHPKPLSCLTIPHPPPFSLRRRAQGEGLQKEERKKFLWNRNRR